MFLLAFYILLKPALPLVDYFINYGYIVAELCVNRDKPELECNGKCYLTEQLAEASEEELPFAENQKEAVSGFQILFLQEAKAFVFPISAEENKALNWFYKDQYSYRITAALLRPPILS